MAIIQSNAAYNARIDAFATPTDYTKTYKFIHNDVYSDLNLTLEDPAGLVENMTYPASDGVVPVTDADKEETFRLTFKPNIKSLVPSNGDSLTVKLIASYTNNNSEPKVAYLEIRVEDGTCVCPAKVSATAWLNFMCHNLGDDPVLDIISPYQLITRAHHGDWYKFGAKNASMKNVPDNDAVVPGTNWQTDTYPCQSSGSWPENGGTGIGNPCPAGWKLPTDADLRALLLYNTATNVFSSWYPYDTNQSEFRNANKFGDYLIKPASGERDYSNGRLIYRGASAAWWCSNQDGSGRPLYLGGGAGTPSVSYHFSRHVAYSVRCVQAE
jgi:uncharacterized protein (TIGR02145 family)